MKIKKTSGTAVLNGNVVDNLTDNSSTNAPSQRAVNEALLDVYSTEEQVVGIWKDGKPTYKKTYTGTLDIQETSSSKAIIDIPTNIDAFIKKEGNFIWNDGYYEQDFPLVWDNKSCVLRKVGNQIHYFSNMGIGVGTYNITIEYTKTTD